jgi:hypothetical protein
MNEVFLETLIELVSNNEKTIQETKGLIKELPDHREILAQIGTRMDNIEKEVQEVPSRVSIPVAEILILQQLLQDHCRQLAIPLKKEVRHEHHMSKPLLGYVIAILVILGLILLEYHTWNRAGQHEENDIKYRYLKVSKDGSQQKFLHALDSAYTSNPGQFRKDVLLEEDHQREESEKWQRLEEKKGEVKELEKETQGQAGVSKSTEKSLKKSK